MVVRTSRGAVRGTAIPEGAEFLGIPYAAPPVGERRYVAPVPHEPWAELDATAFAPVMPQPVRSLPGLNTRPMMGPPWEHTAPALALNIWTPSLEGEHPVMVNFHGGAFVAGAPSAELYHGAAFARDGVVLVTVAYRLGIEGWLALEGGETNVALRDMLAALHWIQTEIASFGGDPGNVTAFGQSAGAMSLGWMLGRLDGLAHRVISQSGGVALTHSREQAAIVTDHLAGMLGVAATAEAFAQVPLAQIIDAQAKLVPGSVAIPDDPTLGLIVLLPVRDGDLIAEDPLSHTGTLPLLIGDTTEEGNLYVAGRPDPDLDVAARLTRKLFREPTAALARAHAGPMWVYEFAWRSQALNGRLGAAHAVELPFVFDTLDAPGIVGDDGLLGPEGGPPELAARMHAAWIAFARDGDPGWPRGERYVFC